jgi:single-stranded-DNA-specific exonuclease
MIEHLWQMKDRVILLVTSTDWPKGVVGLAAGRLAELYKRPVIVLETGDEESTGSARTGSEFDLVSALKSASHLLVKYGGHKQAAGLTLKNKDVPAFYQALLDYAKSLPKDANKIDTRSK